MSKQKKAYEKPEMTIIPTGSPKYNQIMALLKTEDTKTKEQEAIPPPCRAQVIF